MDRLKKLLTEAKSVKEQINVIADAICEDPDLNVEELIAEGVIDTLTAARANMKAVAKLLVSKPERILYSLSKQSGIPVDELREMSIHEKNQVVLDLMANDAKEQADAISRMW